ncbi:MAG: hypothetical protein CMD58_04160 [Gammaproteobacteria bacterium]|nr:hypothetical protein [Gammaproteobacteria bacterium]|tara:strand:- start:2333 stop:2773 length:441 start_codon:yes stop_codon:yes gene_type:complete
MFNIFKKKSKEIKNSQPSFEIELTAVVLAYEIARTDGNIDESELSILMEEIKKVALKVGKDEDEILKIVEIYSKDSVSFYEFIDDINKNYSKDEKLSLLQFMWRTAFADGVLDVGEERLIRRTADLIFIKDLDVLRIKDNVKKSDS